MTGRLSNARAAAVLCREAVTRGGAGVAAALLAEVGRLADGGAFAFLEPAGDTPDEVAAAEAAEDLVPSWRRERHVVPAGVVAAELTRLAGLEDDAAAWLAAAFGDLAASGAPRHPGARLLVALQCKSWTLEAAAAIAAGRGRIAA